MGLSSALGGLLFFLRLTGIYAAFVTENCTEYEFLFERVFSVPGDVAMLNSNLVDPDVFHFTTVPYNITWHESTTDQEMSNQTGRILIRGETLWFLNVTLDDAGEYVIILRTPSHCYRQTMKLVVNLPDIGQCGKPNKTEQKLTSGVNGQLSCPLLDYIDQLKSYNITTSLTWYKGCDPIQDGQAGRYTFLDPRYLVINIAEAQDKGTYTCTLKFTLGGITGSVSETISVLFSDMYFLYPHMHEPNNESIKAQKGSNFTKQCRVFVKGNYNNGDSSTIEWYRWNNSTLKTETSERVHKHNRSSWYYDHQEKGVWMEQLLVISEVKEMDYYINYTCQASNSHGDTKAYFILLPADPNILVPIGSVLGAVMVLFFFSVFVHYIFKVDIVLWFRRVFPFLYTNKDLDGRLYDAYVAYPQPGEVGFNNQVENFALHTLPQVLENTCGYKLFIAGRDCLPGQALIDSVEENIQASRRILLLYTASTFSSKRHTSSTSSNNNNIAKISDTSDNGKSKTDDKRRMISFGGGDDSYPDARQQLECVAAMHRALLEGSVEVILVELEEITPAQLALFPESVRHLRRKQGAVCWWKNLKTKQRWRTCRSSRGDEQKEEQDTQLSPSLSPSSRFWKEIRFHMPVKGKRVEYPEKRALLNL